MKFQREFLIRLAPVWLACRYRLMGGALVGSWSKPDIAFDLLGMKDYGCEMGLLCAEARRFSTVRSEGARPKT